MLLRRYLVILPACTRRDHAHPPSHDHAEIPGEVHQRVQCPRQAAELASRAALMALNATLLNPKLRIQRSIYARVRILCSSVMIQAMKVSPILPRHAVRNVDRCADAEQLSVSSSGFSRQIPTYRETGDLSRPPRTLHLQTAQRKPIYPMRVPMQRSDIA